MKISIALKSLLGAGALTLPLMAFAESNVQSGAATAAPGATAHLDFSVVIPKILYLRVGTGSAYSSGALTSVNTIDLITFSPAAGTVGNGTAVAGTGGDLSGGVETAAIVSNSGNVTLNATASGALGNGNGDSIPFTQITTASSALTSGTPLPAPILTNGTSSNVLLTAPSSKLIVQDAKWTYSYANAANVPAGTYGGVNANNSRVTYTATMP
ncbi:MAG TPA: hypothetical protein VN692_19340 [Steroidobacteraceae bacterium]|nr:hypothetical protein [Steroidobacteraceae bacterium]